MWHRIVLPASGDAGEEGRLLSNLDEARLRALDQAAQHAAANRNAGRPAQLKYDLAEVFRSVEPDGSRVLYLNDPALTLYQAIGGDRPRQEVAELPDDTGLAPVFQGRVASIA